MTIRRSALALAVAVGCSASALSGQTAPTGDVAGGVANHATRMNGQTDLVRPGDQVKLSFWREPEFSGVYDVDSDGEVVLPFVGRRQVAFRPAGEVKTALERAFEDQLLDQDVQVVFLKRIRVLGAVNQPGIFQVDRSMSLSDVVALAGGARPDGELSRARLFRDATIVTELEVASEPIGPQLSSGDEIFVPRQSWFRRNSTVLVGTGASLTAALIYRGIIR